MPAFMALLTAGTVTFAVSRTLPLPLILQVPLLVIVWVAVFTPTYRILTNLRPD